MNRATPPEGLRFGGDWPWWTGPPVNEMPAAVPSGWTLFATSEVSVHLTEADVYSTGVHFTLTAFAPEPEGHQAELEREALLDAIEKGEKIGDGDSGIQLVRISPSWRSTEWMPDIEVVFADGRVALDADFQNGGRTAAPGGADDARLVPRAAPQGIAAVPVSAATTGADGRALLVAVARCRGRRLRDRCDGIS